MFKRYLIESPRYRGSPYFRTADSSDWFTLMGKPELAKSGKWPDNGVPPVRIDCLAVTVGTATRYAETVSVQAWVTPKPVKTRKDWQGKDVKVKSSQHRIMCECPGCGRVMGAGRLFQHKCKGK
jgi:hypothetical protein